MQGFVNQRTQQLRMSNFEDKAHHFRPLRMLNITDTRDKLGLKLVTVCVVQHFSVDMDSYLCPKPAFKKQKLYSGHLHCMVLVSIVLCAVSQ